MKNFLSALYSRADARHHGKGMASRRCGFECLEPRQMLAADLALGAADISLGHTDGSTGSISGNVFSSVSAANCDGHAATDSLADVLVQLLDETGAVMEESRSDATGSYHFDDLIPGQYAVRQIAQLGPLGGVSLQVSSHVGDGGGIALATNLVGEIVVQAGETFEGYDFCNFANEPTALPILSLSLQASPLTQTTVLAEQPLLATTSDASFVASSPLSMKRQEPVFGGSSRSLKAKSEGVKPWDDNPFDSLFSTVNFFEIASAELPTVESFETILGEPLLGNTVFGKTDENSDLPTTHAYTMNSTEWCADEACLELGELLGDAAIVDFEAESAELAAPKIARLENATKP